MTSGGKVI